MVRVNHSRKLLPASLVAIATLTLLSFCRADAPSTVPVVANAGTQQTAKNAGVQQAVGVIAPQDSVIQQVVGKQPKPRKTRPGLLQVLAGSKPRGDANHQHENMAKGDSKGLLDVLFSNGSKSVAKKSSSSKGTQKPRSTGNANTAGKNADQSKSGMSLKPGRSVASPRFSIDLGSKKSPTRAKSSTRMSGSQVTSSRSASTKTASSSKAKSGAVNWDGIPYHSASAIRQDDDPQPMRDPIAGAESDDSGMRIIRGGSRTIPARPASTRQPASTNSSEASTTLVVPQPPRDIEPLPATKNFSSTSSSRRSNRRTLQPLKQQINAKPERTASLPTKAPAVSKEEKSVVETNELIPRVSRKTVQKNVASNEDSGEAAPKKSTNEIVSNGLGKDASGIKTEVQDSASSTSEVVENKPSIAPGSPRVVPRRPAGVKGVPSQEVAIRESASVTNDKPITTAKTDHSSESQTAVAAIGVPLVATPAISENARSDDSVKQNLLAVPKPVNSSEFEAPQSVAIVPSLPANPQVPNVPNIATFPKITANTGVQSGSRFPQPVLAPTPATSLEPPYTIPASPSASSTAPKTPYVASAPVLGPPTTAASHRAGPPSSAFGSTGIGSQATVEGQPSSSIAPSMPIGSGIANGSPAPLRTNGVDASKPSVLASDANSGISQLPTPSFGLPSPQPASDSGTTETFNGNPNRIATNFNRSSDGRNRMRSPSQATGLTNSTSELPGIRVATFGPSEVTIRQVNEYEIRVENRGAIDARGVIVRAMIPDWADMKGQNVTVGNVNADSKGNFEHLVWTIDRLPAGTTEKMFIRLIAARSGSYGLDVDWTMQPQKSVAKVRVHEPKLDLTIEGPDQVIYGMSQTYIVRVLNAGDGTAPNVVFTLSPTSATPQTQRIGDIPAGKEAQFDVELTAQDLGDLKIHGLASGDLELKSEASKTIRVAAAKIEAVLSGPQLKYQHAEAMYGLQLQNNGSAASENVVATLRLPAGVKYLGGLEGVVAQGNLLKWRLSSLKPGTMQNYQFRCQMTSTGEHVFAFDCAGTAAGTSNVSIATRVESIADLVLTVADPPAPAPIGSDVTYEIVIRNRGSKEATNVRAVAQFGHGIEPQRIEGHTGEVVPGQVMFNAIPRIGAGAEVRLRVIAQAEKAGHHRFRAEVHSGDTMLVAEEATHYMSSQSDRVSRRSSEAGSR